MSEGYEGQRLEETVAARWQQYGLSIEQLDEVRRAARERETQGLRGLDQNDRRLSQADRGLDASDISQAALEAWPSVTTDENKRHNMAGEEQAREIARLDEAA